MAKKRKKERELSGDELMQYGFIVLVVLLVLYYILSSKGLI